MFLNNDISDIHLTPLSVNHLFDQRLYGIRPNMGPVMSQ